MAAAKPKATIDYEGSTYEYDPTIAKSYRFAKTCAKAMDDASAFYDAIESLFMGKDVEYADQLGGTSKEFMALASAIMEKEGSKN